MIVKRYNLSTSDDDFFYPMEPERYAELWPQYVLQLKNIFLGPNGAIYDNNLKLIPEANYNYCYWNKSVPTPQSPLDSQRDIYLKIERPLPSKIKELPSEKNYVYGHCYFNVYVYGHLHDNLQDLKKIEQINVRDPILLTPRLTKHVNNLNHHLSLFGYTSNNINELGLGDNSDFLYKIDTLYYPSPTAYPSCASKDGLKFIKKKYKELGGNQPSNAKLYLTRPPDKRCVANNHEIIKLLKNKGFIILDGGESLQSHVGLFRGAKIIIGAHGALFKNIIFCENNPRILEFYAHNRSNQCFLGIAKTAGISEYHFLEETGDKIHNIDINPLKIKQLI